MKDFSDYTVSFTAASTLGNNVWRLLGIHSRIVLDDNNSLVNYGVSSMLSYAPAEKSETKILVRTNNNNGLQPMGDWMPDRSKIYDSCLELNKYYNFNYKLYGQSITASCVDTDTSTELFSVKAEDYFKDEYTGSVIPTNKGTVAITRNDLACYIKTLSVSVEIEKLPKYRSTNAATAELTVNMDKNSYIKLDSLNFILDEKTVNGASMRWTTERQPLYEINNSAKEFAAYGNGSFKLSAVYDRRTYEVTFNVTEEDVEKVHSFSLVSVTGSGSLAIKPVDGGTNDYTVTVTAGDGTEFKQLSLYNKTLRIINTTDETGRVFGFTADKPSDIKLTAEFFAKDTDMNTYALGATVNQVKQGVRFGYRTSAIKRANAGSEFGTLSKKIQTADGTVEVTSMGVLMLPTALLNGELTVDTAKVKNSEVKTVISLTDSFADFAFTIINIPTSQLGTELTVRPYMKYEKEDGSVEYVYGETQQRSFNDINSSILENLDVSLLKLTGGTTNDYDDNAATTSVSYNKGDTITFNVWTKYSGVDFTGVKLKWEIYQDGDAEVYETTEGKKAIRLNPVATGEEISSATKPLTVSITPNKLEAGTVYLHVKAYTADGKAYSGVQDFTGGAVYNKDAITPSVSAPADFETFWQTMADDVEDFFTSKTEDLKVTVSELNAGYVKEYSNGDKISIKPASDKVSGYSSSAYCYEVRIEYGSSSGRAASAFVSIPKTGGNIIKGIGFMGYNTGNPSGLWCVGNWMYANSEAHGIDFDDPDNTRATYTEKYNEPNFLFNYDNLSETELANIVLTDTEYYRMYERNTYILRFMHYLSVEGYTDNGKVALHGGSMGGMQALSLAGIDALFTNNCVSGVDINLAAWCLDLSGKTALGTLTSWAPMGNSVVNYFDTVLFANFINKKNTRINLVAGLGDLTSPTYSQLAFYNTLEKNASIKFSQNASHGASDSQGVQCSYSK